MNYVFVQADVAADLARHSIEVHLFNQRSVAEILKMIRMLAGMTGQADKGEILVNSLQTNIDRVSRLANQLNKQPKVFFEEWDEPIISGIHWVSELTEIAGGIECFPKLGTEPLAKNRIIANNNLVIERQPDIIIGSWCGKKFRPEQVAARTGWQAIPAVANGDLYEIKSPLILQPGPAALTDGLDQLF